MRCSVINSQSEQCKNEVLTPGICSTHQYRLRRYGDVQADRPIRAYSERKTTKVERYAGNTETERFWSRVVEDEGHWLWAGSFIRDAAGEETDQGQAIFDGFSQTARRIAYILVHGDIPEQVKVHHTCSTWSCVKHTEARWPNGTVFHPELAVRDTEWLVRSLAKGVAA
ncbi:HNH endonuclease [Streptomyces phage phiScoe55]|nr:HNH endonuclease [Streptomyces phage phiScoe55]